MVNEVFLRLIDVEKVTWQDRGPRKRLGETRRGCTLRDNELSTIDEALDELALLDARKAKVIELRFFGGLSVDEAAEVVKISPQSVMRDWKMARAWLMVQLKA